MAKDKKHKKKIIKEVKNLALQAKSVAIDNYSGVSANQMNYLRKQARQNNIYLKVIQNNLAKIAIKGTKFKCMHNKIKGTLLMAFTEDPSLIAKLFCKFIKKNQSLKIGNISFNNEMFEKEKLIELSQLPSKQEIIIEFYEIIKKPVQQFIDLIKEIPNQYIECLIELYKKNKY